MKSLNQLSETEKVESSEKEKISEGIKHRLGDWNRNDVHKLESHIQSLIFRTYGDDQSVFACWKEMFDMCAESTPEGRNKEGKGVVPGRIVHTHISNSPDIAPKSIVDRLPWVINHDDPEADKKITIHELLDIIRGFLK